jgi:hypothetical protein
MQRSGSETSSTPDKSRQATLTDDRSEMCGPLTSRAIPSAISLLASEGGPTPSASPGGQIIDLFGQALAPASRLAGPASEPSNRMSATFGRIGTGSSASVALERYLANRLTTRLPLAGLTMRFVTWRRKHTPARRQFYQLVVSRPRTNGSEFSLWPTPTKNENSGDLEKKEARRIKAKAKWGKRTGNGFGYSLAELAMMFELWPTPTAVTNSGGTALCKWGGTASREKLRGAVGNAVLNGSLNPAFPCWLMGFPTAWEESAPTETPSSLKSRRNLSPPQAR